MRSALAAAGVAAVTGGILLLSGVQREISGGVAGIAGITAGIAQRRKSKMVREDSDNNEEATEGEDLYGLAVSEYEAGNYADAARLFSRVLELNDASTEVYRLRGYAWGELGEWEKQIQDYSTAIEMGSAEDDLHLNRAFAYYNAGLYESAITDFNESIESREDNRFVAFANRGNALFNLGKYGEAIGDYSSAISLQKDDADVFYNRARAHQEARNLQNAIIDFDNALRIDPQNIDYIIDRGIAWEQLGEKEKAIRDFANAISITPDSYRAHLLRGKAERDIGRLDNAIRDFTTAIEIAPTAVEAIKERGFTNGKAGNSELAINDYTSAIDLEPQNAVLYYCRGLWKQEALDLEGALIDLNYSTELDPEYPNPYRIRAGIELGEGRYTNAIAELSRVAYYRDLIERIVISLDEAEVIGRKSEASIPYAENSEQRNKFSEIIEKICSELVLDPFLAHVVCGYTFRKTNNKSAALVHLRVLELTASVHGAILQCLEYREVFSDDMIVNYLERLGGTQAAITYLERLRHDNPEVAELCFRLGNMYLKAEEDMKAIEMMTRAIELRIEGELLQKAYATRCNAYLCLQRYRECIADIDNFFAMSSFEPSHAFMAKLLNDRSTCKKKLGDLEGALRDAERTVELVRNEIYLNDLGNIQQDIGLLDEAICSFTQAYNIAPETSFILTNRANAKHKKGDLEGALEDYSIALDSGDNSAFYNRGFLNLNDRQDYASAISDFTNAIEHESCPEIQWGYYNRALARSRNNDLQGALRDCDMALEIKPDYMKAIRLKAKILFGLEELYLAKEWYTKILGSGDEDIIDLYEIGKVENKMGIHEEAIIHLRSSLDRNTPIDNVSEVGFDKEIFTQASYYLANSFYNLKEYDKAIEVSTDCAKYCDLDAEFCRLVACIYDDAGETALAFDSINRALTLDSTSPTIWYDRGVIRRDSGDLEGAIADFKQAFALDSSFTSACHNIGSIYRDIGTMTQACHYWKMASDLGDQDSKKLLDEYCGEE